MNQNPPTPNQSQSRAEVSQPLDPLDSKQPFIDTASPHTTDKKWLVPVLTALLVIAVGIAGYFGYQNSLLKNTQSTIPKVAISPSPTADSTSILEPTSYSTESWETYSDDFLPITFKYPPTFSSSKQNAPALQSGDKAIQVWIEGPIVGLNCLEKYSEKAVTIDGVEILLEYNRGINSENCGDTSSDRMIFISPSSLENKATFTYSYSESNQEEAEKIFDQMLSTFKFVEAKNGISQKNFIQTLRWV